MPHPFLQRKKTLALAQIALSAALLAVCAWLTIPFSPPITMQTFAIFTMLLLFGARKSLFALLLYLSMGAIGLPVFSGFGGGVGILFGPSGGYLWGFLPLIGVYALFSRWRHGRTIIAVLASFLGLLTCYCCGATWYVLLHANGMGIWQVICITILPFLLPDCIKLMLALLVSGAIQRSGIL